MHAQLDEEGEGLSKANFLALARFSLDKDKDLIEISCQMISTMIANSTKSHVNNEITTLHRCSKEILAYLNHSDQHKFLELEMLCLIIQVYLSLFGTEEISQQVFDRILQGISQENCLNQPNILAVCLKLIDDGIGVFSKTIPNTRHLLVHLISNLYFFLNSAHSYSNFSKELVTLHKHPSHPTLKLFLAHQPASLRRIKSILQRLILTLSHHFPNDFIAVIQDQFDDDNPLYCCSLVDLLRKYMKNPHNINLHLIELAVSSLDQKNARLRRFCYQPVIKLLHQLDAVSNLVTQQKDKLAVAHDGIIHLFDLRYGLKLKAMDQLQTQIDSIAFDSNAELLASFSIKDNNIKVIKLINRVSLGVLVKVSCEFTLTFDTTQPTTLFWDEDSEYIYLGDDYSFQVI